MSDPITRDEAVQEAGECPHCGLTGQVVIYRPGYSGLPTEERQTASGKPYRARMRAVAYCICPVGKWMKRANPNDRITPSLADVLEGRLPWLLSNPMTEDLPNEVRDGNWQDAVAWMIARQARSVVEKVKPVRVQRYPGVPHDSVLTCDRQDEPGSNG